MVEFTLLGETLKKKGESEVQLHTQSTEAATGGVL